MADIEQGTLEVGTNGHGEVVVNHPDLEPDENGVGDIRLLRRAGARFG